MPTPAQQPTPDFKGDHVSPEMFGALAGAADNTAAVQAALADAAANRRSVWFPRIYTVQTINLSSNLLLHGPGGLDIIDDGTTTGRSLYGNGISNVTLRDICLISSNATSRTGLYGNLRIQGCNNVVVDNVRFNGGSSTAVHAIDCHGLVLQNCDVRNMKADGFHVTRGSTGIRIVHNYFTLLGDDAIGLIGYVGGGGTWGPIHGFVIADNIIEDSIMWGRGIGLYGAQHGVVANNRISNVANFGIIVGAAIGSTNPDDDTHFCHHVEFANNIIRQTGREASSHAQGGYYLSFCREVAVRGGRVFDLYSGAAAVDISFLAKDIAIKDVDLSQCGAGVVVSQTVYTASAQPRMFQELFTDLGETGVVSAGISNVDIDASIRETATDAVFLTSNGLTPYVNNVRCRVRILKSGGRGIFSSYVDQLQILRSQIIGCTGEQISVAGGSRPQIGLSQILNGVSTGILLVAVDHGIVSACQVMGNGNGGIYADGSGNNNQVHGNQISGNTSFQVILAEATSTKFVNLGDDFGGGCGISFGTDGRILALGLSLLQEVTSLPSPGAGAVGYIYRYNKHLWICQQAPVGGAYGWWRLDLPITDANLGSGDVQKYVGVDAATGVFGLNYPLPPYTSGNEGQYVTPNSSGVLIWSPLPTPTPPPPGLYLSAISANDLTLNNTWIDCPGASVTLTRTCAWKITGIFKFQVAAGDTAYGVFGIGSIPGPNEISATVTGTYTGVWVISGTVGDVVSIMGANAGAGVDKALAGSVIIAETI